MKLLELPAELVRTILHFLDPDSFYMCLQSSELFREHALASTNLLLDQLSRVPGPKAPPGNARDAVQLFKEFGKRAVKNLCDGTEWMADMHTWLSQPCVDRRVSMFLRLNTPREREFPDDACPPDPATSQLAFVEVRRDATINIYGMEPHRRKEDYLPQLKFVISAHSFWKHFRIQGFHDGLEVTYKVLKVAPYIPSAAMMEIEGQQPGPRIAVLYLVTLRHRSEATEVVRHPMKLLIFRLDAEFGPVVLETFDVGNYLEEQVVAVAVSSSREPVVLYRSHGLAAQGNRLVRYRLRKDKAYSERGVMCFPDVVSYDIPPLMERIADVSTYYKSIHLYPCAYPMRQWTVPMRSSFDGRVERRDTYLPDAMEVFSNPSLGKAIAKFHQHYIEDSDQNEGEETCINTALELMITRKRLDDLRTRTGAYILKAMQYPESCQQFDLHADYNNLDHVFVAQLVGIPDLHNLSTLGLKVAVSPRAHRIAIAHWKTVQVWSLDPDAFLDPAYGLGGGDGVPGDHAYIEGCGWQFYSCNDVYRDCVLLEPVELPTAGVVYGLEFRHEDELWGWSDKGLVRWRFGVHGRRQRGISELL